MFGDVVSLGTVLISICASEELAEDWVVGFLDALGLDVPSGENQRGDVEKALFRVLDFACAEDEFRMGREVRYTLWR